MESDKNNKSVNWAFAIFLVFIIVGLSINQCYQNRISEKPHEVICVHIDNVYFRRGGIFIEFGYSFNGVYYHTGFGNEGDITKESYHQYDNEAKRNIFIVVLKDKPGLFYMLENTKDFHKFNIIPSDTAGIACDNLIFSK